MKLSTLTLLRAKTVLMASGLMIVLAAGAGVAPELLSPQLPGGM